MIFSRMPHLAAAGALALVLAACGGGGGEKAGDVPTLRRGISAKVDTLDPHKSSAQWENIIIGDMFIGLTTDGPDARPRPGMATSWETSDDGLVWTFHIGTSATTTGLTAIR